MRERQIKSTATVLTGDRTGNASMTSGRCLQMWATRIRVRTLGPRVLHTRHASRVRDGGGDGGGGQVRTLTKAPSRDLSRAATGLRNGFLPVWR